MDYFLGIDLGTSYFKAGIFDATGHLKGLGRQYVHKITDGTICELPVDVFWKTIRDCLDEAIQMAGISVNSIKSVSYSTQANSFILLDKNNDPLTPLILWPDHRADSMELPATGKDFMEHTGLGIPLDAQFAISKLNWFRKNQSATWEKIASILSISDYLTFSLTGQKVCDFSSASMSGLFDVADSFWWSEQLENFGIRTDMLPLPQRTGTYVGTTTTSAAALTGLPAGIPFCLGGLDHHIAATGAGIPSNGFTSESTGTVLSCVDDTDGYAPANNICVAPGIHPCRFFRMRFDENGATSLEWYQKNYAPDHSIPELLEMAALVTPGSEGLIAHPCASRYSGLDGFTHANDFRYQHGHYVRALLESTAYSLKRMIGEMNQWYPVDAIVSSGGGSRSEFWVKVKAGIVHTPFLIPECTESACMGAAMMGALGTHASGSYDDIVNTWVRFSKKIIGQ